MSESITKKRVVVGDFVTRDEVEEPGSWMITDMIYNHVQNVTQARISKVCSPQQVEFVDPATLTVIEKNYYK